MSVESNSGPQPDLAVAVRGLTVTRGKVTLIDGVDASIPAGKCSAILGPNGCGKTTFTRVLLGQAFFSAGAVSVLGQTLGRTDVRALRRRIGIVNPTTDSAGAHISGAVVDADLSTTEAVLTGFFGTVGLYDKPTAEQRDRAAALLRDVGLGHRLDLRFNLLSTGEQRRALIARALCHVPELLILDEPTAGLDIRGREEVLATIENVLNLPTPPTVLFITHHVEELSPRTAKVLLMKEGRFIAEGKPEQTITPESLSRVFDCKVYVQQRNGRFWLEVLPEAWLDFGER